MEKGRIIAAVVWLAGVAIIVAVPDKWADTIIGGIAVSVALFTVGALLSGDRDTV